MKDFDVFDIGWIHPGQKMCNCFSNEKVYNAKLSKNIFDIFVPDYSPEGTNVTVSARKDMTLLSPFHTNESEQAHTSRLL